MIKEAKSQGLQGKLEPQENQRHSSSLRQERTHVSAPAVRQAKLPLPQSFSSRMVLTDWMGPRDIGEDNVFYSAYLFKCQPHPETSSQTPPE